ncbi:AHH domain-containing protein [Clostridium sp.]|uniref:AHH domain-containing protein n=1 Tax=Clostridium sp. TaxID=1506 RepID=UPI002612F671|nr:AHH domain-containing protein [Clostridium sp.]
MEIIIFSAAALVVYGVSVFAMHNSVSNSKSAASEAMDDIVKERERLKKKIEMMLFLGMVTITAKIISWQQEKEKAQKERINDIANATGGAAGAITAATLNAAQNAIEATKGIGEQVSETTASSIRDVIDSVYAPDVGDNNPPPFIPPNVGSMNLGPLIPPKIPDEGVIQNPLEPPDVGPIGTPQLVPPDLGPTNPPHLVPPAVASKGLEDYINLANKNKPNQEHHFLTNKSKKYTQQFEKIAKKYKLDLDDAWNKELMPHQGRHPYAYHEYVLREIIKYDNIARGDKAKFLKLYEQLKNKIMNNPDMLTKDYWK